MCVLRKPCLTHCQVDCGLRVSELGAGEPYSGKTFCCVDRGGAILRGRVLLGIEKDPGKRSHVVVYFSCSHLSWQQDHLHVAICQRLQAKKLSGSHPLRLCLNVFHCPKANVPYGTLHSARSPTMAIPPSL